jgi:ribonuclease R
MWRGRRRTWLGLSAKKVVEVLGDGFDPLNDAKRVLFSHQIPTEFPGKVLKECESLPEEVTEEDFGNRKDLRKLDFVTIDGATAKDFDDAIFVKSSRSGFRAWIAIADVSHYVKPSTEIDKEAYKRGNSTYFPNLVIPMLPEQLSNNLCSLKPKVPRLAMVAEVDLDHSGVVQKSSFYPAVIESKARVIYGEAQEIIDGNTPKHLQHVEKAILKAYDLAKILTKKRRKEGSLNIEVPETQILLDEASNPIDIIKADRIYAHQLIEEMMLVANVAVAMFFVDKKLPCLFRIHEPPPAEKLQFLNKFLERFGKTKVGYGGNIRKKINKALQEFQGKPLEQILNILTLRSMSQAQYSAENLGHFGLGFDDYLHFTSPIRRYPDLIIHRLLKSHTDKTDKLSSDEGRLLLHSAGVHLTACEQRSQKSEWDYLGIKKARFMEQHLGREFTGVVCSVTRFGIFVLLREFDVDGLVKIENLGNDRFVYDEENIELVGKRTGTKFSLGDTLEVQVAATDPELGRMDFILSGDNDGTSDNRKTNRKNHKKRRSSKNNRGSVRKTRLSKHRRNR